ncbi:MAG: DUF4421 domain-containing protein [Bacteroidota bacterium]
MKILGKHLHRVFLTTAVLIANLRVRTNGAGLFAHLFNKHPVRKPTRLSVLFMLSGMIMVQHLAQAQADTTRYIAFDDLVTGRFYFSRKYTGLLVRDAGRGIELNYQPNTTLNMGVGATYRSLTLNLAYGFPFLNPDEGRGNTRYLDLQAHLYGRKTIVDLFGQFYGGFYLEPKGAGRSDSLYYVRPDLLLRELGASMQYMFNHRRFSYRAAALQNEWQVKSAGTFLLGGECFAGRALADSSIYPSLIANDSVPDANRMRFFEFGPNFGYAYTLVLARHFFITASLSVSMDYNRTEYSDGTRLTVEQGLSPNSIFRLYAGYNSARSALSITFTNSRVALSSDASNSVSINTGNVRINYVRRFQAGPRVKRTLDRFLK